MSQFYPQAVVVLTVIWEDYQRGKPDVSKPSVIPVTPNSVSVSINDYKTADTFSVTLDYRHFPFDPRTIRSLGVTIYMEDMLRLAQGQHRIKPSTENLMFTGFADVSSIDMDDDKRDVTFTGRDNTALLIDAKWDGSLLNIGGKPVDKVIESIMKRLVSVEKMEVVNRTSMARLPTLSGITGVTDKDQRNANADESYWDVIQDVATRAGLIAYVEIDKLILTTPNALYKKEDAKQFIYGRNLSDLKLERKIGRMKDTNLRLMSLNVRASPPVIEAFIPKDATASFRKRMKLPADHLKIERPATKSEKKKALTAAPPAPGTPGDDGNPETTQEIAPMITFRIPNAKNKAQLVAIGEEIFEQMSRQQIEGSLSTSEMAVRNGDKKIFDITKTRIGTAIEVRIDNEDLAGIRDGETQANRYKFLKDRGYDDSVARALSSSMQGFKSPFYTKAVTFKYEADGGFSMDLQFLNFIELSESLLGGAVPSVGGSSKSEFKGFGSTGDWIKNKGKDA